MSVYGMKKYVNTFPHVATASLAIAALSATITASCASAAQPAASHSPHYTIKDLGAFSTKSELEVTGMNAQGDVVIQDSSDDAKSLKTYVYHNDKLQKLEPTAGFDVVGGGKINDAGLLSVSVFKLSSDTADFDFAHAATGSVNDLKLQEIMPLANVETVAQSVNNQGSIVGYYIDLTNNIFNGFVFNPNQPVRLLKPLLNFNACFAIDINNREQVVGLSLNLDADDAANVWRACTWQNNQATDVLGDQYQGSSEPIAINNNGQVIGSFSPSDTTLNDFQFLYTPGTGVENLGTLANAIALNDYGDVVGSVITSRVSLSKKPFLRQQSSTNAALYHKGAVVNLNTRIAPNSGWVLTEAQAINNDGAIAGIGLLNGKQHAFLLTPKSVSATE